MSLSEDLLEQAEMLINEKTTQLEQVNFRRAISNCYYALFHKLIEDCSLSAVSGTGLLELQSKIRRNMTHYDIKAVSQYFATDFKLTPIPISHIMKPNSPERQDIALVADSLMKLQEERHSADYDTNVPFTREQAKISLGAAKDSLAAWARICQEPVGRAYQYYLLNPKIITDHCKTSNTR